MISIYLLLIAQIILYSLNPLLKKIASKNVSYNKFVTMYQIFSLVFSFCHIIYLYKFKNITLTELKKIDNKDLVFCFLAVLTGFLGSILFLYIVKLDELSYLVPNIQGIVILFNLFLSYFVLNEKMPLNKCIGTLLIFIGILFLNYNHYNNKYLKV